jgi:NADPH-dependent 2,4-dienoyl-CoA reductase/sulfur reductase-like enzyme
LNKHATDILIVGGGAAGMSAAMAASASDASVTLVDDNPHLGGQIWRAELGKTKNPEATKLIDAVTTGRIKIIKNAQVFVAPVPNLLSAETPDDRLDLEYKKLIIATGARELFLPFPGWTLPSVFGAGGLQALVKSGLNIKDKRVVVAGTGPLLLAVADYLKSKGAKVVVIAEQTSAAKIRRFARGLWRSPEKMIQAAALRARLVGIPYHTDCWVTSCAFPRASNGDTRTLTVTIQRHGSTRTVDCDYLACGYHLVPNLELPSLLDCRIEKGFVAVDEFQRTSCENIHCSGEPTGIGGIEASLVEGTIAGYAATGEDAKAKHHFATRDKTRKFADALNRAFTLRDELKTLATNDTFVCRCEDVEYSCLKNFESWRVAKLQTRCGMGACQGRICGAATEFLFGWEKDSPRPPIFPVRMENL